MNRMPETNWTVSLSQWATTSLEDYEKTWYGATKKITHLDEEKRDYKNSKEFTTGQTSSFKNRD